MLIAIDAVGIRDGGGASILLELLHWLPLIRPSWHWHVFLLERKNRQFDDPPPSANVVLDSTSYGNSGLARIAWCNIHLPRQMQLLKIDVLFSLVNMGPVCPKIPQVIYCHNALALFGQARSSYSFAGYLRMRLHQFLILRGARASNALVVQIPGMRKRLLEAEPRLGERVHVIPGGYRTPSVSAELRPEKKFLIDNCPKPRLIYVSLLRSHKNHAVLISALSELVKKIPTVRLLLTVDDQPHVSSPDGLLHKRLLEMVEQLGIRDNVVWLGQLNPDEVSYALRMSDLLVFPSLVESFGLPLVEAMAAGCPIAAADLPYALEVAGAAAAYFNPLDSSSLSECLFTLLSDSERLARLTLEGQAAKGRFSYEIIAGAIAQLLASASESTSGKIPDFGRQARSARR